MDRGTQPLMDGLKDHGTRCGGAEGRRMTGGRLADLHAISARHLHAFRGLSRVGLGR